MNRSEGKCPNAAPWIAMLVVGAVGEIFGLISAVIFGVSAFSQTDAAERSRLWTSAGWCLLAMFVFTALSTWSLVRLLRMIARQAPNPSFETSEP